MDPQSQNFYTNLAKVSPYGVIGAIFSLGFNLIMINATKITSPSHLGWPFSSGSLTNGDIRYNIIGFVMNLIVWTFIFAIIIPVLKGLFFKGGNA